MELHTINQVSKNYKISTRMLRYYEQVGLISSLRKDDYAYRVYDETAVRRLQFIIILRKLRISVKQISDILNNQNALMAVEIFEKNIKELDEEITALSTVKSILARFVKELREKADIQLQFDLLNDKSALSIIDSISFSKNLIQEGLSMDELNKADESLLRLKEKYIRIIYLPPMTVAEVNFYGESFLPGEENYLSDEENKVSNLPNGLTLPEHFSSGLNAVDRLIRVTDLAKIKPDFRLFGFSNLGDFADDPEMKKYGVFYGFGRWLTIPDDMEVPFPFVKKHINGGLYCAFNRSCVNGEGQEWEVLNHFVTHDSKYEFDFGREPKCNYGILEEYLNYINIYKMPFKEKPYIQVDYIMPIKERS
ncbi:MAG: MerR family transcriptional regulator [Clostridia bacterium]|nr:MerR family transcriptional regulator [Clostridia bacterium]